MRLIWLSAFGLVACGALRENPLPDAGAAAQHEGGTSDDDVPGDDAEVLPHDAAFTDAGPDAPPIREDYACAGTDGWDAPERSAECMDRTTQVVQPHPSDAFESYGRIDVAWSSSGRAAIVLAWLTDFESGYLQSLQFDTAPRSVSVRPDRVETSVGTAIEGAGAKVIGRPDGTFDVLSMLDVSRDGGDVSLRRLTPGEGFLSPTLVVPSAHRVGQLALARDPSGVLTMTAVVVRGATDLAIVGTRRASDDSELEQLAGSPNTFFDPGPPGNGNHRLVIDPLGSFQLAYEAGFSSVRSQPRAARLSAIGWDDQRTIDNNVPDGVSGEQLSYFFLGDERNAVYLREVETGTPTVHGQLVRARWRSTLDAIEPGVLVDDLPVTDDHDFKPILARAVAAADASGALSVVYSAVVSAGDAGAGRLCRVRYLHEARQHGALVMLQDDVSGVIGCELDEPPVALAIEPGGRPHIAYLDETKGVVYATRYDR